MIQAATDLRTLWFMGVKTRILEGFIDGAVADLVEPGATLLDLCCGTGVVGRSLADRYRIFANDVQQFGTTIAGAHLVGDDSWREALEHLDPEEDLQRSFQGNFEQLERFVDEPLSREDDLLPRVIGELGAGTAGNAVEDYRRMLECSPSPGEPSRGEGNLYAKLGPLYDGFLEQRRAQPDLLPYGLFTLYFQNTYFGLRQCLALDSLRAAIAKIPDKDPHRERKQALYLAALLYAASISTSGTSHFAQPRSTRKDSELHAVAKRRTQDIDLEFHRALDAIRREWGERTQHFAHRVFNGDGETLLRPGSALDDESLDVVYLDPPYTSDNYSRFYHVLETLVTYDYPELERRAGQVTRGIYPVKEQRFTSDFCRTDGVEKAFRTIAEHTARRGAKLLVSYSEDSGLLLKQWRKAGEENPRGKFRELFRDSFDQVEIRDRSLLHSGQGDSNRKTTELLVLCE